MVKLKGLGTVGCHFFGLSGGRLFVSILSAASLSMLSLLFDGLQVLQLLDAERISLLRSVFASLSLHLVDKSNYYRLSVINFQPQTGADIIFTDKLEDPDPLRVRQTFQMEIMTLDYRPSTPRSYTSFLASSNYCNLRTTA